MNNSEHISMDDIMMIERPYDKRPIFKISWKMTHLCPYACSYCYMSNAVEKAKMCKDNPTQKKVEEIASHFDEMLSKLADEKDEVQLHLIGGEPSVFDLIKVIAKIKDKRLRYISVASNIYRDYPYWEKLITYCKLREIDIGVSASFHLEQLDTKKKRDEYANKVIGLKLQCKAVVNNENIKDYKPYFDRFMEANRAIEITLERNNKNECCKLSEENQKYIDLIREYQYSRKQSNKTYLPYYTVTLKNGRKIGYSSNIALINSIKEGALNPSGFYCTAGLHNVRIDLKGNLTRSACRLCSMYFKMGNILKGDCEKPDEMVICKCREAGKDHIYQDKYCTAFNNTSMYRLGYDRVTGLYNANHGIEIPDYHKLTYGN